jgi:ABC-type taurine transport system substrate-binding protein
MPEDDSALRYTDMPNVVRLARLKGMSNRQVVRLLTGGRTHTDARQIAVEVAPLLGVSTAEFMRLRKND